MTRTEEHKHYWLGFNSQHHNDELTIIKMNYPRCFIRLDVNVEYCCDIGEFYYEIIDVQWFDGDRPTPEEQNRIMVDAWEFLFAAYQLILICQIAKLPNLNN
jgi:hypothetical protein